ncbi:MAG TPA: 4a-hydroxytetrahydrobiopterin dehydratase [Thermoanaerobaculia bacterium]|nr:4a-hydroxytetrahydrobiopterin dehydratase [Thermoanaerobaculia bacterium]
MSTKQRLSRSEQLLEALLTSKPVKANLKSERVQDTNRLQRDLQDIPEWKLGEDSQAIHRVKEFRSLAAAEAFVGFVGKLATLTRQPVTLALAGKLVGVTLAGHPVVGCTGGLNKTVIRLAGMIG